MTSATRREGRHRVIIVGGGFAGLNAARALRDPRLDVILIDRRNFHLFQPLLYQVATGGLSPADIASPLREILRHRLNVRVLLGEVIDLDVAARRVTFRTGGVDGGTSEMPYDTLVVAAGMRNSYFGNDAWEAHAPGLKTIEDATEIRKRILYAFEAAELEPDPVIRQEWLSFIVIGGGPTGVEMAGTIGELARDTLRRDFRAFDPGDAKITVLELSPRILQTFPEELASRAAMALESHGVSVRASTRVIRVERSGVELEFAGERSFLSGRTVVWAAGVAASPLGNLIGRRTGAPLDRAGRVIVEAELTVPGHPEILVVGDLATSSHQTGRPLPGVAPVAMQQGRYVARLLEARLDGRSVGPFRYRDKGNLATVGRSFAVADLGRSLRFSGFLAWVLWIFVHLMYLVGFDNRLLVLLQWAWNYVTWNRGARLITAPGEAHPPSA